MEKSTDAELIDRCLAFAADKIGDLHPPVLEKYHDRLPGAKAELARHDDSGELEHSMVEQALYCLMTWFVRPMEVQIVLRETVPHHIQTLMVPLLESVGLEQLFHVLPESLYIQCQILHGQMKRPPRQHTQRQTDPVVPIHRCKGNIQTEHQCT